MQHVWAARKPAMPMQSLAFVLAAVGLQPLSTLGQEAGDDTTVRTAPVVVTPTRVEQSAFDLPVSIDAFDQQQIRR